MTGGGALFKPTTKNRLSIGSENRAFPFTHLDWIIPTATYFFSFIQSTYEKLHESLLQKHRSVKLADIVRTCQ